MDDLIEPVAPQTGQRRRARCGHRRQQGPHLLLLASILMSMAVGFYALPVSGGARVIASLGALLCMLGARTLVFGMRRREGQSHQQGEASRVALEQARQEEPRRRREGQERARVRKRVFRR